MKKTLFILFAFLHLSVVVYNNIIIEEQALNQYYHQQQKPGAAFDLLGKQPVCLAVFDWYSKYTGAETGYGLYAPNVSSDIVIMMTCIDAHGRIISIESPKLSTCEARLRFSSAAGMFMEKTGPLDKTRNQYLDVVLKSMAMWTHEQKAGCKQVFADLLVYDLPSAHAIQEQKHPSYIKLGHYEYNF